jgi:uncharacterized BrkB/YihY/UPF0761 family membrane protein
MALLQRILSRLTALQAELERRYFAFAVFMAAVRAFNQHHCPDLAAAIAYYAIFSLFPLLLGLIALASLFIQTAAAEDRIVSAVAQILPGSANLVRDNIALVLKSRGTIGLIAIVTLLWAGKAVFGEMTTALNLAWNVPETRSFWHRPRDSFRTPPKYLKTAARWNACPVQNSSHFAHSALSAPSHP